MGYYGYLDQKPIGLFPCILEYCRKYYICFVQQHDPNKLADFDVFFKRMKNSLETQ